ncbi:hypothetical protein ACS0TY_017341 [Phlomoides rotata]
MGGGAIRSAAKVAGMAAATGGLRSFTPEHLTFSSSARMPSSGRPVASNLESGGVQMPCVELDDWVLPFKEEVGIEASDPMPRLVFGGPPTLQEAKEATSELSIALEKAFLSPSKSIGYGSSSVSDQGSSLSLSSVEDIETKACVTTEIVGAPSLPAPAIRAFKLLNESSMAKDVVASIASDMNVWTAVLQNKDLQNFLESERACVACAGNFSMEYVGDCDANSAADSDESTESSGFSGFFQKMKTRVVNMLSSLSDYFKDLFGGKGDGTLSDAFMERSFMGLAVMAILVILLKRA